ncbi:MAG: LPS export ABC transporter periplasmic protein LptC [Treponemataceae bacterium]
MKNLLLLFVLLFCGCSFTKDEKLFYESPKIIFENMNIVQYKKAKKKNFVTAEFLESFPAKEVFAGKNLYIVQFNNSEPLEAEVKFSAGNALFLQKEKQYFLGENVYVQTKQDGLTIYASSFFYNAEENMLYGVQGDKVRIQTDDGTLITGTDFVANTLSQEFQLLQNVSGSAELKSSESNTETTNSETETEERAEQ